MVGASRDISGLAAPVVAPRGLVVPLIVGCALFMQMLDTTVVANALPAMAQSLQQDPGRLNLAITSYLLSLAVFIPISGWVADRFGARTVFAAAIAVFTASSALCGAAHSLGFLIFARMLQGVGGAMMVPVGRLVMLKTVPKSELMRAMSFLTAPAVFGSVLGAPVGGVHRHLPVLAVDLLHQHPRGRAGRGAGALADPEYP